MMGRSRRIHTIVAATLAIAGITAGAGATSSLAAPQWGPCPPPAFGETPPGQECTNVSVPLDYGQPGGRRIDIAVSRLITSTPERRRGVLLLYPGGPGNAALDMPGLFAQYLPHSVLERYDLIGFDPRGNGRSAPLTCGLSPSQIPAQRVIPWPDPRGFDANIAYARFLAQSCGSSSTSDLLPFITTENRARDVDLIR
jgi:pimeloyl-ACP methyl ester carboxylesterase